MKNFPHQVADIDKLESAFRMIAKLIAAGESVASDSTLGAALARGGYYAFRDKSLTIEQSLAAEEKKKPSDRGSYTAARDTRRTFKLLGFIEQAAVDSDFEITEIGQSLLDAEDDTQRHEVWRLAMRNVQLSDKAGNASHPYQIMLRLVTDIPGIETSKLMLALEALDDSEDEYLRIRELAELPTAEIREKLGVSKSHARNATKILPAIARQIGDIVGDGGRSYPAPVTLITEDGAATVSVERAEREVDVSPEAAVAVDEIAPVPEFGEAEKVTVDLTGAIAIRQQRTERHQLTVQSLARLFSDQGFFLYENPYDCLAVTDDMRSLLCEVKTLDGSLTDERQQAIRALGQLKGYRFFNLPKNLIGKLSVDVIAFDSRPRPHTIEFLAQSDVTTIWLFDGGWWIIDQDGNELNFDPVALLS
ncbi:hypothetical protein [Burkholderia multivorans]|uniref:hypothetical protein n=1 Tax=Burkholderia multivorans TaxID=87883 RepID=UPI0021C01FF8|nr:hypothetical protein [Burkholderia multivorans]